MSHMIKWIFTIHQPGYYKNIGYYVKLALADHFLSFDTTQYVCRERQNRQKFMVHKQCRRLTIPVLGGRGRINTKVIDEWYYRQQHIDTLCQKYKYYPQWSSYKYILHTIYKNTWYYLHDINDTLTFVVLRELKVVTQYIRLSSLYSDTCKPDKKTISKWAKIVMHIKKYQHLIKQYSRCAYIIWYRQKHLHYMERSNDLWIQEREIMQEEDVSPKYYTIYSVHKRVMNISWVEFVLMFGSRASQIFHYLLSKAQHIEK